MTHGKLIIQNLMEQQFGFYILREFLVHRIPGEDEKVCFSIRDYLSLRTVTVDL